MWLHCRHPVRLRCTYGEANHCVDIPVQNLSKRAPCNAPPTYHPTIHNISTMRAHLWFQQHTLAPLAAREAYADYVLSDANDGLHLTLQLQAARRTTPLTLLVCMNGRICTVCLRHWYGAEQFRRPTSHILYEISHASPNAGAKVQHIGLVELLTQVRPLRMKTFFPRHHLHLAITLPLSTLLRAVPQRHSKTHR